METKQLDRFAVAVFLLLSLSSCRGTGIDELNSPGWDAESKEDKEEDSWWDRFTGKKKPGFTSTEWQDYYKPPAPETPKSSTCGFWGNTCTTDGKPDKQGWW